jgi:hypothetical protein
MGIPTTLRASIRAFLTIGAGCLLASCSGPEVDAKQQDAMKKGFADRPAISQLPPAQKARAEAMKQMAEAMAKSGPAGAPPASR